MIPLTGLQSEIMTEFYSHPKTRVLFDKRQRSLLWNQATKRVETLDFSYLREVCPALEHQIRKSYESGKNIQSAVFSECVYAQTFANMFSLSVFVNCLEEQGFIPAQIVSLLNSYHLSPRYVYTNADRSRMLIQAGGCNGIDSALITVANLNIYTIEFKEQGAKTSEPDLPKYGEDGNLLITDEFLQRYPQFEEMLREHQDLNFFSVMGSNINDFTKESIHVAVTNNYAKKYADVICTEDVDGFLVMLPVNQVALWADIEGEIRPAGRNHYAVWTPRALERFLLEKGASIENGIVTIPRRNLTERRARGGNRKISGYKINSLFFVYVEHCTERDGMVIFDIHDTQQLNPTIAGKLFFNGLKYDRVKSYYNV